MAQLIKDKSLLSERQVKEFRQIIEAGKDDNFERNFIVKKPYP